MVGTFFPTPIGDGNTDGRELSTIWRLEIEVPPSIGLAFGIWNGARFKERGPLFSSGVALLALTTLPSYALTGAQDNMTRSKPQITPIGGKHRFFITISSFVNKLL